MKNVKEYNLSSRNVKHHANLANCLYERVEKVTSKVILFGFALGKIYTVCCNKTRTNRSVGLSRMQFLKVRSKEAVLLEIWMRF